MNTIDLNFTGVERPKFEPVPEGEYTLTLSGCEIKKSKSNAENLVAHLVYEINDEEYSGKKIFATQVVAGPGANQEYLKLWLEALTDQELTDEFTFDPDQLIGLEVQAFIGIKPDYKDDTKETNDIKYYIPTF